MLEKLTARNFQPHKKVTIHFHQGVTYIAGPNDAGKSALFRLLKWICLNKRPRSKFIHWGAKRASGDLLIDGRLVRREFDGRSHIYSLDGERYKAVGTQGIPDDIRKLLSLSVINFQDHRDHTFWFGLSPLALSRELNKLVDLESIDRVQADLIKRVRSKKAEIAVVEKRLAAAEKKVKQLRPITRIDDKLGKLEKMGQYRLKSHRTAQLRSLIGARVVQRTRRQTAANGARIASVASRIGTHGRTMADRAQKLRNLVVTIECHNKIKESPMPNLIELEKLVGAAKQLRVEHKELSQLIQEQKRSKSKLCKCRKKLRVAKKKLEKKLGGRCPTCGGILTDRSPL